MAVIEVKEDIDRRTSEITMRGRKHMRPYIVTCDATTDGPYTAVRAALLPIQGDSHPEDPVALAIRFGSAPREGHPQVFNVDVEYSTILDGEFNPAIEPWDREPELEVVGITTLEEMVTDLTGKRVVNTAGVPYEPSIVREVTEPALTFTRNMRRYYPSRFDRFTDALNIDTFLDVPPKHAKINFIAGRYFREGNWRYWRVTYAIRFNFTKLGFEPETLETGTHELLTGVTLDGEPNQTLRAAISVPSVKPVADVSNEYETKGFVTVTEPLGLDADGLVLPANTPPEQYHTTIYKRYIYAIFGQLGIETPIIQRMAGG